jgi:Zn-dependent protease
MDPAGRIYLGHIGKVPVYLALDAIFLVVIVIMFYGSGKSLDQLLMILLALVLTILLHELGHALVAMAVGMYGVAITITGLGGLCSYTGERHPKQELLISAAGPATNLILAAFCWTVIDHGGLSDETLNTLLTYFFLFNLGLGIFNSLPIFPLDGGQMALSLSRMVTREHTARRFTLGLSFVAAIVGLGVYVAIFHAISPFTLVLVMFLLITAYRELR